MPPRVKTCTDLGATAAKSIAEVTKGADVVMTSLPMPKDVEAVTLGDNGILATHQPRARPISISAPTRRRW